MNSKSPKCSGRGWDPNEAIPRSPYAVLVRAHHGLGWSEDLRLMMRALMVECQKAKIHVWLLHQVRFHRTQVEECT